MQTRSRTVAITGASGFVGGALVEEFAKRGWRVIALTRGSEIERDGVSWRAYNMDAALPDDLLRAVDVVIHAAYVREGSAGNAFERNVAAARVLWELAGRHGARFVYISSLASHDRALSSYGRHKRVVERMLEGSSAVVIRPGLVVGRGGLLGRLARQLRRAPIVPLIDRGDQPLQAVLLPDLTRAVFNIVGLNLRGTFVIADPEPVLYRRFFEVFAATIGVRPIFLRVPFRIANALSLVFAAFGIQGPVDRDNLLGLRAMERCEATMDPDVIDFRLRSSLEAAAAFETEAY